MYGSETMLWKKEISRIMAVQMDNLRSLATIRRMDSPKFMDKGVVQSDEGVLQWFSHVEWKENDRFAKRVCRRVCGAWRGFVRGNASGVAWGMNP